MLTSDYQIAWGIYLVAALGCFWAWTVFTGWMWRYLREPLWLIAAVLLFTPTQVSSSADAGLAPALAVAAMDLLFKTNNAAWQALANFSMVGVGAVAAYVVFALLRWVWQRQRKAKASAQEKQEQESTNEPTMQELLQQAESSDEPLVARR